MARAQASAIAPDARYQALFGATLPELPGTRHREIRRHREASFERFMTAGFPGPKSEAWKYTQVGSLAKLEFELAPLVHLSRSDIADHLIDDPGATRLVFVNGRFAADLSDEPSAAGRTTVCSLAEALERGDPTAADHLTEADTVRGFSALNGAFVSDGGIVQIADGAVPAGPIQLLFVTAGDGQRAMLNPRNVVVVGDRARLNLIESHVSLSDGRRLTNLINRIVIGRGAEVRHERLQPASASDLIGRTEYTVSADARLTQSVATIGGALVRNEIEARIEGSNAELRLNGLYLARDREHVDSNILIEHAAPGSMSDQSYKGVLDGRAQGVFAGKIVVRRQAQKTNAYQSNDNLLLSPEAEIDTKPELEIFADDVKCSHGATAGELDERELFYLRSRGLDRDLARSLLTFAFAGEVLERFSNETIARHARQAVLGWLQGGTDLEELLT